MRRPLTLGLLLASALLATAGGALAALQDRTKTTTIEPKGTGSVTATCPKGDEVASGGFETDFGTGVNFGTISRRTTNRGWKAGAWNFDSAEAGPETAHAYCSKHALDLQTRSAVRTLVAHTGGGVVATCPRGSEAVSGGFSAPVDPSGQNAAMDLHQSNRISRRKWKTAAFNEGNADGKLKSFAYCDQHPLGLKERSKTITVPGPEDTNQTAVRCPKGQQAYSGGFDSPFLSNGNQVHDIVPFSSFRVTTRKWFVGAGNFGGDGDLTVFAYCAG